MFLKSKRYLRTCVLEYFHFTYLHMRRCVSLKRAHLGRLHRQEYLLTVVGQNSTTQHAPLQPAPRLRSKPFAFAALTSRPPPRSFLDPSASALGPPLACRGYLERGFAYGGRCASAAAAAAQSFLLNSHTGPSVSMDTRSGTLWGATPIRAELKRECVSCVCVYDTRTRAGVSNMQRTQMHQILPETCTRGMLVHVWPCYLRMASQPRLTRPRCTCFLQGRSRHQRAAAASGTVAVGDCVRVGMRRVTVS